jgi:hypothetical protein
MVIMTTCMALLIGATADLWDARANLARSLAASCSAVK